jgi:hypothetical protein
VIDALAGRQSVCQVWKHGQMASIMHLISFPRDAWTPYQLTPTTARMTSAGLRANENDRQTMPT